MQILVVGASGATGRLLVDQLLEAGAQVKVVVRTTAQIPEHWKDSKMLTVVEGNVLEMELTKLATLLSDCQSVVSCLGHNLTWKGIYGKPRKLVTQSVKRLCEAIVKIQPEMQVKFILMNTAGNRNRDLNEPLGLGHRFVIALLRLLLPPHPDNEKAADYLRVMVGQSHAHIEWVVVRPDTLLNEPKVSAYRLHTSPTRSALFNPGKTSRINVAHFMSRLTVDEALWLQWKGQMPVIYNAFI